jgi:hypothetical protein
MKGWECGRGGRRRYRTAATLPSGGEFGGEEVDLHPRSGSACGITEAVGFVEDRL